MVFRSTHITRVYKVRLIQMEFLYLHLNIAHMMNFKEDESEYKSRYNAKAFSRAMRDLFRGLTQLPSKRVMWKPKGKVREEK